MMQASAADGGGFKGRSNKLVDGCYSWWVGGSMTVLEEGVKGGRTEEQRIEDKSECVADEMGWTTSGLSLMLFRCMACPVGSLYDRGQ